MVRAATAPTRRVRSSRSPSRHRVQLPAAGVEHRPANEREQGKKSKRLQKGGTESVPVPPEQHLHQRQQVDQNGLAQDVQGCKGVEPLFGGHEDSSVRMAARASACTAGTPGSSRCPPGQRITSTLAPASHSRGVRSR